MKKEKDQSTFNRLIEAAKIEMSKNGFGGATIEQITNRAEVAKGTFYLYFDTKEDVVKCMMEEMLDRIRSVLEESRTELEKPGVEFRAVIRSTIMRTLKEYYELKDVVLTVYTVQQDLSKEMFSFRSAVFMKLRKHVEKLIEVSIGKGFVRPVRTDMISYILFAIFTHLAMDILFKEGIESLDEYVAIVEDFILNGLKSLPEQGKLGPVR